MVLDEALVSSVIVEEERGDLATRWSWVEAGVEVAVDEGAGEAGLGRRALPSERVAVGVGRGLGNSCGNRYDEVAMQATLDTVIYCSLWNRRILACSGARVGWYTCYRPIWKWY